MGVSATLTISDWLGELQTKPRKTPKSFVKPPFYLLALALAQHTNGERLTYGNNKKTWERWSDEEVSVLLAIYSEDATQQLLLKPGPNSKV